MPTRRELLAGSSALLAAACTTLPRPGLDRFVRTAGNRFTRGGARYPIVGANMWAAAYLGATAPIGNRDRLKRELDRLSGIGVNNVRILGSSELSPLKNSVRPTFRDQTANYNETLLRAF